jgi:5-methylcytosine-specific restriction endonuclease McrA
MNNYLRRTIVPVDEVVWHIKSSWNYEDTKVQLHGFEVGVSSLRLKTFGRDHGKLFCAHCGLQGAFFSIDSFRNQTQYTHLNLYALDADGQEVLLTCDHILARGLGGANNLSNTQVLCSPCNSRKGSVEGHQVNVKRFVNKMTPDTRRKVMEMLAAQENPLAPEVIELKLNEWAMKVSADAFSRKIDTWLQKVGWKRKRLKQEMNEGKIMFTRYPVRD